MSTQSFKLAVTGGSGVVGRTVVRHLVARGHDVINIDQKFAPDQPGRFIFMDLRQREFLQPVFEQVDAVLHLGEIPHAGIFSDHHTFAHNTAVAATVLSTAAELKLRHLVYTSTCQVYGTWGGPVVPPLRLPVDETHPVQPTNAYALSKVANESYCRFVNAQHGLRISIFRLPWVLPPAQEDRMIRWMRRGADSRERDGMATYIHASDVATAYEAAVLANLEGCRTYNLSAADSMLRQSIHAQLAEHHPDWPSLAADFPGERSVLSAERAQQELGWTPRWSVREKFEQTTGERW